MKKGLTVSLIAVLSLLVLSTVGMAESKSISASLTVSQNVKVSATNTSLGFPSEAGDMDATGWYETNGDVDIEIEHNKDLEIYIESERTDEWQPDGDAQGDKFPALYNNKDAGYTLETEWLVNHRTRNETGDFDEWSGWSTFTTDEGFAFTSPNQTLYHVDKKNKDDEWVHHGTDGWAKMLIKVRARREGAYDPAGTYSASLDFVYATSNWE